MTGLDERKRQLLYGALLLAAAAGLRILWNDVPQYSNADEAVYVSQTRYLVEHGWWSYPGLVAQYLGDATRWLYPPPSRWGFLALTTLTGHLLGRVDARALAWLSTLAGIASVALTIAVGRRLFSNRVALVAGALMLTSPLQLAMGRRALQEELFCAALLAALWALLPILDSEVQATRKDYALALAALTLAFTIKETTLGIYPALLTLLVAAVRRRGWRRLDLTLLFVPPAAYVAGFALWSRSAGDFFRVAAAEASTTGAEYAARYQAGPPHRILLDLFVLAPIVMLLAIAAVTLIARTHDPVTRGARVLALYAGVIALVMCFIVSKNVRYAIGLDPPLRLLAAYALVELARPRLAGLILAVNAAAELLIFHAVFIAARVYDPVTDNLLRALGAIP